MNNTRLGISFALMTAALIVGVTLAYSSANASMVVEKMAELQEMEEMAA